MAFSGGPNIRKGLYVRNAEVLIITRSKDIKLLNAQNAATSTIYLPVPSFKITSCLCTNCYLVCSSSLLITRESVL